MRSTPTQANSKTVFADALFTYMPHPGTALYVGYIGNFANIDRALCTREEGGLCDPNDPHPQPPTGLLAHERRQEHLRQAFVPPALLAKSLL